jgi:hypothetical protein
VIATLPPDFLATAKTALREMLDGRCYRSLDDGEWRREVVALAVELRYSDLLCGV